MAQDQKKKRMGISGFIAFISCPCHLPITLPVILSITAGTSLGVWISNNTVLLAAVSSVVFFGSLLLTFYWANKQDNACSLPNEKPKRKNYEIFDMQ